MNSTQQKNYTLPIIMMILLFGMISFVTNLAAPMGVVLKNQFGVSNSLGMLGNLMNFLAYAVMGIPSGKLLQKIGYKKTALIAIAVGFTGVGVQFLSGIAGSFYIYLLGAFIAGFSMCMLNAVVNPMLNTLGGAGKKGNTLIQIGGSFNSLMGTLVPLLVGVLVGNVAKASIPDVNPVLFIALGIFALVGVVLFFVNIPEPESTINKVGKGEKSAHSPWSFRHFVFGAIAIFVYVGVEVGVPGTANLYMTSFTMEGARSTVAEYEKQKDASYLAQLKAEDEANVDNKAYISKIVSPNTNESAEKIVNGKTKPGLGIAAGIAGGVIGFYWLLMLIGRLIGAAIGTKISSKIMLTVASGLGLLLVLTAILLPVTTKISMPAFDTSGGALSAGFIEVPVTFFFLALVGICTSVMWGSIFNLAVKGLGKYVAEASGIFMMLVVGGGIIPYVQNVIADMAGFMTSYWLLFICLAYLLYYALIGNRNVNKDIPVE
jgi:FHS family L-fucose permease-like MFS transporter